LVPFTVGRIVVVMGTMVSNWGRRCPADLGATSFFSTSSDSQPIRQELVQAFAIPRGDFENPIISHDAKSLAGAVHENAAPVATAKVLFDFGAKPRIEIFVDVVGQLFQ
jgi:hypothetical protein